MPSTAFKLDTFTKSYILAALWTEDPNPGQGEYQPHGKWTPENLTRESLAKIVIDCEKFQAENAEDIGGETDQAGHDFWLTRNGHGCGFWDGDWPEDAGERLTAAAEKFGESHLELCGGKLHIS